MFVRRIGFLVFCYIYFYVDGASGLCTRKECECVPFKSNSVLAKCSFQSRQRMTIKASDFPSNLGAVVMSGGRELRFEVEVFNHLIHLESVAVRGVLQVFVQKHSFANMSSRSHVSFEFSDANIVIFEGMSWKSLEGPISVLVARVNQTIINGKAFSRLVNFTAVDVKSLELLDEAFYITKYDKDLTYNEKENITINLERVHIETLNRKTFQSIVHEIRISGSGVKKVMAGAFSALEIDRVIIENTTLHRVETAAFSDQTLIRSLTLKQAKLYDVESAAFLSGLSNLVIVHSILELVRPGALNVTVATVRLSDNIFNYVHSHGVVFKEWNKLTISNNTFKEIESQAFTSPTISPPVNSASPAGDHLVVNGEPVKTQEFNFTGNMMIRIRESAFDFPVNDESKVLINNNFFLINCWCDMNRVETFISGGRTAIFDTGLCSVDENLSRCYQLPRGFVNMSNFTENVCKVHGRIECEEAQMDEEQSVFSPTMTSMDEPEDDVEREMRIVTSLFTIMLFGVAVVVMVTSLTWIGRKGYCAKAHRLMLPSTNTFMGHLSRLFSNRGVSPAVSVSRLSVHEYAELQRKLEEAKTLEDDAPVEDKATQTLPEELTQELLQSLKEKLNDPQNYSEARDMIEHLYDLIKVEENCNRNCRESTCIDMDDDGDNMYDVIRPKRPPSAPKTIKPTLVTTGTRAPSPDKLMPYVKRTTVVSEYMEPKDRQVHTYSELPSRPDLLPGPLVSTSILLANRPLPAEPTQL